MKYNVQRDLAICGLACVLCSEGDCPGCKTRGSRQGCDCSLYGCATEKGLDGCYECEAYPCAEGMLQGTRIRAFNRYARQYGKEALLDRLRINSQNGIVYHKPDGLKGDYDQLQTGEDILRLIRFGTHDPYVKCPVLETEHFRLRLVRMEDAKDLLVCYSDPASQKIFDAANCTSDFCYGTMDEMLECIRFFRLNYENRGFIRFSILDKASGRAVGTLEMFNATGNLAGSDRWGVLRIDLASAYETHEALSELLALSNETYYPLMNVDRVVTKAIPAAAIRSAALQKAGFAPFDWPEEEREHYWVRDGQ